MNAMNRLIDKVKCWLGFHAWVVADWDEELCDEWPQTFCVRCWK